MLASCVVPRFATPIDMCSYFGPHLHRNGQAAASRNLSISTLSAHKGLPSSSTCQSSINVWGKERKRHLLMAIVADSVDRSAAVRNSFNNTKRVTANWAEVLAYRGREGAAQEPGGRSGKDAGWGRVAACWAWGMSETAQGSPGFSRKAGKNGRRSSS
ncbi:hypothetical protein MRB53_019098 [Persea americana]|uniref:Uncharacterized protein n=1 Tax=Persea americana TaxID=3435 RepID=A0ACC2MAP9_PERAE|nr:hypothetical protein MRB53_019098 [Persea americana]